MPKLQFRVLYREFLFRMVDLELLSAHAQGDMSKLFGQFASLFVFISILFSGIGYSLANSPLRGAARLLYAWNSERSLIATTMLFVGMLAVLSWDSAFPDRRDVMVLAPLPVLARTMFRAKIAALSTALGLTVGALHVLAGMVWPIVLAIESARHGAAYGSHGGFFGWLRLFLAYWITMLAAGAFVFCSILTIQGLAAQLRRRWFLRLSGFLQLAVFCLFLTVYFMQPSLLGLSLAKQHVILYLPAYWFLGLFQLLNGSLSPDLAPLAQRACIGLAIAMGGAGTAFLLSYFRTIRKIVEEPDIVPGSARVRWLPPFGNAFETAIVQFSIRTLLRSRLHRLILAFYLGVSFAITIFFLRGPIEQLQLRGADWNEVSVPVLASSILMMGFWVVGSRVVFAMPLDLRANWIFRIAPVKGGVKCLAARRRSLVVLALVPAVTASAAILLPIWAWLPVTGHLVVLTLLGIILVEVCLGGIQKIPFTCSYLPGKSNVHVTFWLCIGLLMGIVGQFSNWERMALHDVRLFAGSLAVIGLAAVAARWWMAPDSWDELPVEFEDLPDDAIITLGLSRDGGLVHG